MGDATRRRLTMALARAEEELIETHVRNVVALHDAVGAALELPVVLDLYLEEYEDGEQRAEIVRRRVLAQLATEPERVQRPQRRTDP